LATIIGWTCGTLVAFFLLSKTELKFEASKAFETGVRDAVSAIGKVTVPASVSNAINPIGLAVLTGLVAAEGQSALAGFGAAGRVQSFAVVPLLALSGSIGAIVGQNWGASQIDRADDAFKQAIVFCLGYGLITALILVLAADWLASLFSDDPDVIEQFTTYLTIAAWGYAGFGLLIVSNGTLNAIGYARFALYQSVARVFLIMLPAAWFLLPHWGAHAIYAAELFANVIGGAAALMVVKRLLTKTAG
jgi:Na+-driven multidrug efflux pump